MVQASEQAAKDIETFRMGIFAALVFYIFVVLANALSVLIVFWQVALGHMDIPWNVLGAWAVGTGGLGAGSLIFNAIMPHLFAAEVAPPANSKA